MIPPYGFAIVACAPKDDSQCLYRGAFPILPENQHFLSSLRLKTIISLTPERPQQLEAFAQQNDIDLVHYPSNKVKDGSLPFAAPAMRNVISKLLRRDIYPVYIHDIDGSDAISLVIASLRKVQGYTETAYATEMCRFLREPPAEPDHLTFLNRFLSTSNARDTEELVVPSASQRVRWLWPPSLFTNTNSSSGMSKKLKMRFKILDEPGTNETKAQQREPVSDKGSQERSLSPEQLDQAKADDDESLQDEHDAEFEDEGDEEEEDDDEDDEETVPVSQLVDALDLGL